MKGSVHYHAPAKRWYVNIYWQGQRYRIWKYNGDPLWHEKTAVKLLNKIRAEVDNDTLNIKAYLPESPLSLKALSESWLEASTACANTKRVYRTDVNRAIEYFGKDFYCILLVGAAGFEPIPALSRFSIYQRFGISTKY